ncbi:hypothetical protein IIB51_01040 [Patescibacteria group bacterium]|nr:hypothetical protein [Patescibacteria group bacterium]
MYIFQKSTKAQKALAKVFIVLILSLSFGGFFTPEPVYAIVHNDVIEAVGDAMLTFGSWISGAGAAFLDIALRVTLDSSFYQLGGIRVGWEVFRDLANMAFIFILLYIAFMTVLQIGGVQTKRLVTHVIIAALLVNFSFFLTGAVIDAGNITGSFIYETLTPEVTVTTDTGTLTRKASIGEILSTSLKTSSIYEGVEIEARKTFTFYLMGTIFLLISGFVFLSAGLLFVQRTVVLIIVLIASPVAFVAAILPTGAAQAFWKKWVAALIGNVLVVPVFLVLIAAIMVITLDANFLAGWITPEQELGTAISSGVGKNNNSLLSESAGILMNFAIIIGLLIAALNIAKAAAGEAGATAAKITKRFAKGGVAVGVAVGAGGAGAAALAYRQTAGRIASRVAQNESLQKRAAEGGRFARVQLKAFQGIAGSSGDIRNVKGVSKALGLVGIKGVKGGGKGGFAKKMDDKTKKDEKFADSLGMTDTEKKAYAKNLRDKKSPSRLWLWTSRRDKEAAQRIGKLKEREHNRGILKQIDDFKTKEDYEGKKDAKSEAEQDVDTKRKAYVQARSDGNHSNANEIQYELENAQKVLSEKEKDLTLLDNEIKELKAQRKSIKRKEKGIDDGLKDYFAKNPIDTGKDT